MSDRTPLEKALADMEEKNASQEQWKRDHAKERADFTHRLEDTDKRLASLSQADRRKVLDAAGLHHVSALPAPLEPIRNSGYSTPKPAPLPIEWAHWRLMPQVTLWEAVALSVNENPAVVNPFKADATFNNRMKVALSHVDAGSLPLVLHHPANPPVSRVDLSQFAAWAAGLNFPDMPPELRAMAATAPTAAPAQNAATPAPVGAGYASDAVEPVKAGPVDRGWVIKKAALIKKLGHEWPTIERDFQDASENGLSTMAKAPGHGNWFEAAALKWAEQRGKRTTVPERTAPVLATPFSGLTHKIKG